MAPKVPPSKEAPEIRPYEQDMRIRARAFVRGAAAELMQNMWRLARLEWA